MSFRSHERWVFGAFAIAILYIAYILKREDFGLLFLTYSLAFYAYWHWLEKRRFKSFKHIVTQAIIIRLLLLFSIPSLSDDYFRFIWDGLIQAQGLSPFETLPEDVPFSSDFMSTLFDGMNSKSYHSVYPPVMQWIFHGVYLLAGDSIILNIIGYRIIFILGEIGLFFVAKELLRELKLPLERLALYALNPLVIIEVVGNLHFECLMMMFTLLGILFLIRAMKESKWYFLLIGSATLSLGILTKLVMALSLPALFRKWGMWRTTLVSALTLLMIAVIFWISITPETLTNILSSLDLYFRNFQFNSSLYSMTMAAVKPSIPHYTAETIGPYVTGASVLFIVMIALFRKAKDYQAFFTTLLFILSVHLLFSSTVHPWYLVNLLAVSIFTQYRYVIVWSFTIMASYFMYSNDLIEVGWIIAIEYLIVLGYFLWEHRSKAQIA